jgi:hypothetical protein
MLIITQIDVEPCWMETGKSFGLCSTEPEASPPSQFRTTLMQSTWIVQFNKGHLNGRTEHGARRMVGEGQVKKLEETCKCIVEIHRDEAIRHHMPSMIECYSAQISLY